MRDGSDVGAGGEVAEDGGEAFGAAARLGEHLGVAELVLGQPRGDVAEKGERGDAHAEVAGVDRLDGGAHADGVRAQSAEGVQKNPREATCQAGLSMAYAWEKSLRNRI